MADTQTFERKLFRYGRFRNIVLALIGIFYIFYFPEFPFKYLGLGVLGEMLLVALAVLTVQVGVFPLVNHITMKKLSNLLEVEKKLLPEERTMAIKLLMRLPVRVGSTLCGVFFATVVILATINYFVFYRDVNTTISFLVFGAFISFVGFLLGFTYTEKVASEKAIEILRNGVDAEIIKKSKYFGRSFAWRAVMFIAAVFVLANATVIYQFLQYKWALSTRAFLLNGIDADILMKMFLLVVGNSAISLVFAVHLFRQLSRSYTVINQSLEKLLQNIESHDAYVPTDLGHEYAYNFYLINRMIDALHFKMQDMLIASKNILDSTLTLSSTAKEIAATSTEEAVSVKECFSAMENVNQVLQKVSQMIENVGVVAGETKFDVDDGYELLKDELADKKIHEIIDANIETVAGIKTLNEKIDSVWDIINDIDVIAEKTKTIAFNAELQTSKIGATSEVFHILGNEIRRLASTTTASTQKIKENIKTIQEFSDNLIITSEVGTQKIRESSKFLREFENTFTELRTATDIVAESSIAIQEITGMQNTSFEQIRMTFEQMSEGFDQFSGTSQYLSEAADSLKNVADKLKSQNEEMR